ncbi:MAG: nucleoside triphosphate pyrophosphohydrolase [Litoreibacter sp.]
MGDKNTMSDELIYDATQPMPRLLEIMRRLRDPNTGCPWDIEQTFETIAPYTIEEAYEVADAISSGDMAGLEGELGDLLLQTVYHAAIGEEAGHFTFITIANAISDKMIARHPHVFGDESRDKSAHQQTLDWEKQKALERTAKGEKGVLDGVALGLPALMRAAKLQKRAARVGFDWDDIDKVMEKLREEAEELTEARAQKDADAIEDEMGDLLFVATNLARHLDVDPEAALRRTNDKFTRRFKYIEDTLKDSGDSIQNADLQKMDALWNEAKTLEKK